MGMSFDKIAEALEASDRLTTRQKVRASMDFEATLADPILGKALQLDVLGVSAEAIEGAIWLNAFGEGFLPNGQKKQSQQPNQIPGKTK